MAVLLCVLVVGFLIALVVGAATGRVRMSSCCVAADPRNDLRMRAAFDDETHEPHTH